MMSLLATIAEMFGLALFLPVFQYMRVEGDVGVLVHESDIWAYIIKIFDFFNLEVSLAILLFLSFVFFLGRQCFVYLRVIYKTAVTQRLVKELRDRLFGKYLVADTAYYDTLPVGNFVNAMTGEVGSAVYGVMAPIELLVYCVMALGSLCFLFFLSWQMTLVSFFVVLLACQLPKSWIKQSAIVGRNLVDSNTNISTFLVERLKSPRLVRLAGTEVAEKDEFDKLTQLQRQQSVHSAELLAKTNVVLEPVVIGLSLVFLFFSYSILHMQIEVIGLYLLIVLRLMPVVKSVMTQWQTIQNFLGAIELVEGRLEEMGRSEERNDGTLQIDKFDGIKFKDVSYRYPSAKKDALLDLNLYLPTNSVTALVGPSGGGKSTLIDLLPRLRTPTKGVIELSALSIENYDLASLRQIIAYAPQNPQVFSGTVRNHIRYGKRGASEQEIIYAARLAGVDGFISALPEGYDSLLGEDGKGFSGGQRQRIDLARVLIRKAPLIILDEPTSNLDVESETAFRMALKRIHTETDATIIIISHQLAGIIDADQIVVLNQGRIEAKGRHEELIKMEGWYSRAWKIQSRNE